MTETATISLEPLTIQVDERTWAYADGLGTKPQKVFKAGFYFIPENGDIPSRMAYFDGDSWPKSAAKAFVMQALCLPTRRSTVL